MTLLNHNASEKGGWCVQGLACLALIGIVASACDPPERTSKRQVIPAPPAKQESVPALTAENQPRASSHELASATSLESKHEGDRQPDDPNQTNSQRHILRPDDGQTRHERLDADEALFDETYHRDKRVWGRPDYWRMSQEYWAPEVQRFRHSGLPPEGCPLIAGFDPQQPAVRELLETMISDASDLDPSAPTDSYSGDMYSHYANYAEIGISFVNDEKTLWLDLEVYVFNTTCREAWDYYYFEVTRKLGGPIAGGIVDSKELGFNYQGECVFRVNDEGTPFHAWYRAHNIYLYLYASGGQSMGEGLDPGWTHLIQKFDDHFFNTEKLYPTVAESGLAPCFARFEPTRIEVLPDERIEFDIEFVDPLGSRWPGTTGAFQEPYKFIFIEGNGALVHMWSRNAMNEDIEAAFDLKEKLDSPTWNPFATYSYYIGITNARGLFARQEVVITHKKPPGLKLPPGFPSQDDTHDDRRRGDDDHPGKGHDNSPPPGRDDDDSDPQRPRDNDDHPGKDHDNSPPADREKKGE